ncbi:hypothetical protein DSO57_1009545 [Entomophthora muscae]|uniref:Uncharacterized protein n=2 Tax=Entomophthora muscae TaxID=34485 RepID=A0ACC2S954_9FUNG|nr:hypothetical protein DSO57_1006190 [Entomophthora muscae]KAJ9058712.1 hypothetical protein DSO57_1009545 [Entomophthora muscae]
MSGGKRVYDDPKVWSPAGGAYCNPKNWRRNTAFAAVGLWSSFFVICNFSAKREWRHYPPKRWIPSMMWAAQFNDPNWEIPNKYNIRK